MIRLVLQCLKDPLSWVAVCLYYVKDPLPTASRRLLKLRKEKRTGREELCIKCNLRPLIYYFK